MEIALIPVFQFGVFCGYDCSYFPGPNFSFGGRVHTNQNLFLAAGGDLVFNDKIAAFQQIIMDQLENGHATSTGYGGTVYVPNASGGCPLNTFPPTGAFCVALPGAGTIPGDASWSGGYPLAGLANPNFVSLSSGATLNGFMVNSLTGATNMQLPFVKNSCTSNPPPCTDPISIVRKPQPGEAPSSTLGSARLYNKAEIRVLLADTELDLHPERPGPNGDADDIQFVPNTGWNIPNSAGAQDTSGHNAHGIESFGMAQTNPSINNWINPVGYPTWSSYPLLGEVTTAGIPANGQGAWLRVEYVNNAGTWVGITRKWLTWSFTRQYNIPPSGPTGSGGADPYNPNAILILQQMAPGAASPVGNANAFYPINFYDTREGEMRDANNGCAVNGIMNAVELNVANLALWLKGQGPYGGDPGQYRQLHRPERLHSLLLRSSRHAARSQPIQWRANSRQCDQRRIGAGGCGQLDAAFGFNHSRRHARTQPPTTPIRPKTSIRIVSLDNWGGKNIGYGFGVNTNTPRIPYQATSCNTTGLTNAVTGARHVLKLVEPAA